MKNVMLIVLHAALDIWRGMHSMARVFILSKYPLFGRGVESLLRQETELEIVGQETDADQAIERITELHPDVVIVDSSDPACDPIATITRILKTETPVKVIGLDLKENKIHLYHGEQREARGVEDLVAAIKTELSTSHYNVSKEV